MVAEHAADESVGGPADEADASAASGDAHEFVGGLLVVGCEHHAHAREHDIERAVSERQRLGVGLAPLELSARLGGETPSDVEQLGREVARDHGRAVQCGRNGHVPAARRDVEHALPGLHCGRGDESRPEPPDEVARESRVVARGPHRAVLLLEGAVGV